jgi:hypothetical protein
VPERAIPSCQGKKYMWSGSPSFAQQVACHWCGVTAMPRALRRRATAEGTVKLTRPRRVPWPGAPCRTAAPGRPRFARHEHQEPHTTLLPVGPPL